MSFLILDGMYDSDITLPLHGFGGQQKDAFVKDNAYKSFYHYLPARVVAPETVRVQETMEAGDSKLIMVRGAGQFGVFWGATSDQEDWKVTVYSDPDRTLKMAEFTG